MTDSEDTYRDLFYLVHARTSGVLNALDQERDTYAQYRVRSLGLPVFRDQLLDGLKSHAAGTGFSDKRDNFVRLSAQFAGRMWPKKDKAAYDAFNAAPDPEKALETVVLGALHGIWDWDAVRKMAYEPLDTRT